MRRLVTTVGAVACLVTLSGAGPAFARERPTRLAVFPVDNLTGGAAPPGVRQHFEQRLAAAGVPVLAAAALDEFLTRHRVRSTAGIDGTTAQALRNETGVDGVLIPTVELSSPIVPPRVALIVRLVSIGAEPQVVWADDAGVAGDDAPGWLDLGLVNDHRALLTTALTRLSESLLGYLRTGERQAPSKRAPVFRPRVFYRSRTLDAAKGGSVAILPLLNLSDRRYAGEVMALLFARHLAEQPGFRVVDAGVVRRQLLDGRIIMEGGVSITDARTIADLVDADFVLGGRVLRYEDREGEMANPAVEFSTVLIDKRSRRVVWSSESYNDGNESVGWFGRGGFRTAHAIATQMVGFAVEMITGRSR